MSLDDTETVSAIDSVVDIGQSVSVGEEYESRNI